ncbi:MAG: BamA/TamA family outer membrane protein [Bacteroidota bacterium]
MHSNNSVFALSVTVILLFSFFTDEVQSQHRPNKVVEFFTVRPNKKRAAKDTAIYPSKIIIAPIISYSPETNLAFGAGAKHLFKLPGSGDETRTSNMPLSAQYTLENQFILFSGFEIFSPGEKWMLEGNLRFQKFPRFYYGIGNSTSSSNKERFDYSQILIEPILLKRAFFRYLFIGAGFRYNRISGVEFEQSDGLLANEDIPGVRGSESVGGEFAVVYDSRSNLLNSSSGWYMEFTYGVYDQAWGSSHNFTLKRLDLRRYFTLSSKRKDVLAFQLLTHIANDKAPLAELAYFGSESMMRGYYEGRFIDRTMLAFQAEYRRPIAGRLGGVLFAGLGDVQPDIESFNFSDLKYSLGFGLRFLLEKREKLNLRFDWGFGKGNNNYYFNVGEAF